MSNYFIGIDNGSQSSKVIIFDETGAIHAKGQKTLRPNHTPAPGVVEHPNDDLWDSICAASTEAMGNFVGEVKDIIGVGLCTIRFCRAMLDENGNLAAPVLSWMDDRVSKPYVDDDPNVSYVTTSSGYISARLTSEFRDTAANYQGMWPMDTDTWQWSKDPQIIKACGYPTEKLFELVMPGETLGKISEEASKATGIPRGIPVFATSNDKAVEGLGCGLRSSNEVLVSLGTYIASMTMGDRNISGADHFWPNFACEPKKYLYESDGIRRGMWTVSWLRDLFGREFTIGAEEAGVSCTEDHMNNEAMKVPPGSEGLIVALEWLAPADEPFRKGAFVGFDGRQGRFHMYRAVLEGIAMEMATKAKAMEKELGTQFDRVIVSGGGSNADLMMQIMADTFNLPAVRTEVNNGASLGAAICAAVGTGTYPSFQVASEAMVHQGKAFMPNLEAHHVYAELSPVQASLRHALKDANKKIFEIVG